MLKNVLYSEDIALALCRYTGHGRFDEGTGDDNALYAAVEFEIHQIACHAENPYNRDGFLKLYTLLSEFAEKAQTEKSDLKASFAYHLDKAKDWTRGYGDPEDLLWAMREIGYCREAMAILMHYDTDDHEDLRTQIDEQETLVLKKMEELR